MDVTIGQRLGALSAVTGQTGVPLSPAQRQRDRDVVIVHGHRTDTEVRCTSKLPPQEFLVPYLQAFGLMGLIKARRHDISFPRRMDSF